MLILAMDSTATVSTAALMRDGKILGEYSVNAGNTHSVTLLPMSEHLMKCCNVGVDEIDMYAVSLGPGSFTGVRIGAATVKGLAFKNNTPTVGVSSLEALAENLTHLKGLICPAMNARRDQVYTALFRSDGKKLVRLTKDAAMSVTELSQLLENTKKKSEKLYFTGDGYSMVCHMTNTEVPEKLRFQSAVSVARVAQRIYAENPDADYSPTTLAPVYLRKPQAEREREERLKNE